ncbi:MAG: TrkA family potassium uptake protein [Candidatus Mcinerneyibacterium aminivorans]|uniref:TrkA family potassium uptake protein n=1 Tax=Candidatus Mcinerneyibacterium aminivorans TaxID=2703815 RepID=A0A5D0MG91_9BACT|nr:MAG: TrkA family potassium uptake protein [Candidatus Mcinerneyibacterium aminivorans]
MFILVIGCRRTGSKLAGILSQKGHDIVILDKNPEKFRRLSLEFSGFKIEGDALEHDILKKAKITDVDLLIITTGNDKINYFLAQLAKTEFEIDDIYVRIKDPEKNRMFKDQSKIKVVNPLDLLLDDILASIDKKGEKDAN